MSCDQDKMGTGLCFLVDACHSRRPCRLSPLASANAIVAAFSTAAFSWFFFFAAVTVAAATAAIAIVVASVTAPLPLLLSLPSLLPLQTSKPLLPPLTPLPPPSLPLFSLQLLVDCCIFCRCRCCRRHCCCCCLCCRCHHCHCHCCHCRSCHHCHCCCPYRRQHCCCPRRCHLRGIVRWGGRGEIAVVRVMFCFWWRPRPYYPYACIWSRVATPCEDLTKNSTSQKLYVSTKMSVMKHIFAPLLLRCKEPPMHKQHCRLSINTMKSWSPAALTLKPLRRPSNRSSPRQHFIRLCSHIVHVVYRRTWYVCRIERKTDNWHFLWQNT